MGKIITQFTGMMASIICDIYDIDVKAITHSAQEMWGEPDPVEVAKPPIDKLEPVLNNNELKELAQGILKKNQAKEESLDHPQAKPKINQILSNYHPRYIPFTT